MSEDQTASPETTTSDDDQWQSWTDQQLRDYESRLYERETAGEDVWHERDKVLWEMNARGLCK